MSSVASVSWRVALGIRDFVDQGVDGRRPVLGDAAEVC